MICSDCLIELTKVYKLREKVRACDKIFFEPSRKRSENKEKSLNFGAISKEMCSTLLAEFMQELSIGDATLAQLNERQANKSAKEKIADENSQPTSPIASKSIHEHSKNSSFETSMKALRSGDLPTIQEESAEPTLLNDPDVIFISNDADAILISDDEESDDGNKENEGNNENDGNKENDAHNAPESRPKLVMVIKLPKLIKNSNEMQCKECAESFPTRQLTKKHMQQHFSVKKCLPLGNAWNEKQQSVLWKLKFNI